MKTRNSKLADFLGELKQKVSGELRIDEYSRILYSTDASIYQVMPHGVLIPKTVEDVQTAVALAAKYQIPMLPRDGRQQSGRASGQRSADH